MSLVDVAQRFYEVGVAISYVAKEAEMARETLTDLEEQTGGATSSSMGKSGDGSGGGASMGADQAGAAVGTNTLGAALQMTRGRL